MCSRDSALHSSWACWYIPIQRLVKYQAGSNVSHSRSSVNGQQVQGVMVVQNGTVQTYTCLSPQQYVTVDQSSSGWACFEETTGVWLLHSQPPQTAYSYQQPQVYGTTPAVPVYSYP